MEIGQIDHNEKLFNNKLQDKTKDKLQDTFLDNKLQDTFLDNKLQDTFLDNRTVDRSCIATLFCSI